MKNIIVGIMALICIVGSAGATYLFVDQMKQSETAKYQTEISNLNDIDEDRQEFDRLMFKAMKEVDGAWLNEGYARMCKDEADYYCDIATYGWAETYYGYARDYFSYVNDNCGEANLLFKEAKKYATNDKTREFTQKCIELMNVSRQVANLEYDICDNFRLAYYYYNMSLWDSGDEKINDANEFITQKNNILNSYNDLLTEIDFILETTWKVNK